MWRTVSVTIERLESTGHTTESQGPRAAHLSDALTKRFGSDGAVACLAPLGTNHINVLGRYHFSLPEAIARGEFRPLSDPLNSMTSAP